MKILKSKKIMIPSICGLVAIIITVILIVALVPKNTKAKQMALSSYFGDIEINNGKKNITPKEGLKLFSGYQILTDENEYAYITLDESKIVMLDEKSDLSIKKSGKSLKLTLTSGLLYFEVYQPLKEDEEFSIQTQNLITGIRGTSGIISAISASLNTDIVESVSLFTGTCNITGSVSETITGTNKLIFGNNIPTKTKISEADITPFVSYSLVRLSDILNDDDYTDNLSDFDFDLFNTAHDNAENFENNFVPMGERPECNHSNGFTYAYSSYTEHTKICKDHCGYYVKEKHTTVYDSVTKTVGEDLSITITKEGTCTICELPTRETITFTYVPAKESTCKTKGNSAYYVNGNNMYSSITVANRDVNIVSLNEIPYLPLKAHTIENGSIDYNSCKGICQVCNETITQNHDFILQQNGIYKCSHCEVTKTILNPVETLQTDLQELVTNFNNIDIIEVNNHEIANSSNCTIPANKILYVKNSSLTIGVDGILTVNGTMYINNSALINNGTINNNSNIIIESTGVFQNNFALNNTGTLQISGAYIIGENANYVGTSGTKTLLANSKEYTYAASTEPTCQARGNEAYYYDNNGQNYSSVTILNKQVSATQIEAIPYISQLSHYLTCSSTNYNMCIGTCQYCNSELSQAHNFVLNQDNYYECSNCDTLKSILTAEVTAQINLSEIISSFDNVDIIDVNNYDITTDGSCIIPAGKILYLKNSSLTIDLNSNLTVNGTIYVNNASALINNGTINNNEKIIIESAGIFLDNKTVNNAGLLQINGTHITRENTNYVETTGTKTISPNATYYNFVEANESTCSVQGNTAYFSGNNKQYSSVELINRQVVATEIASIPLLPLAAHRIVDGEIDYASCKGMCETCYKTVTQAHVFAQQDSSYVCSYCGITKDILSTDESAQSNLADELVSFNSVDIVEMNNYIISVSDNCTIPANKILYLNNCSLTISIDCILTVNGTIYVSDTSSLINNGIIENNEKIIIGNTGSFQNNNSLLNAGLFQIAGTYLASEQANSIDITGTLEILENTNADFTLTMFNFGSYENKTGQLINNGTAIIGGEGMNMLINNESMASTVILNNGMLTINGQQNIYISSDSDIINPFITNKGTMYITEDTSFRYVSNPFVNEGSGKTYYKDTTTEISGNVLLAVIINECVTYTLAHTYDSVNSANDAIISLKAENKGYYTGEQYSDQTNSIMSYVIILLNDVTETNDIVFTNGNYTNDSTVFAIDIVMNEHTLNLGEHKIVLDGYNGLSFNVDDYSNKFMELEEANYGRVVAKSYAFELKDNSSFFSNKILIISDLTPIYFSGTTYEEKTNLSNTIVVSKSTSSEEYVVRCISTDANINEYVTNSGIFCRLSYGNFFNVGIDINTYFEQENPNYAKQTVDGIEYETVTLIDM